VSQPAFAKEGWSPPSWDLGPFRLRPVRCGDEPALLDYLSDARVIEHTSIPTATALTVSDSLQRQLESARNGLSCRWALTLADDRLVGTCGFSNWSVIHSHAELVYDLAPAYWGKGFMALAVGTVVNWAFSDAGFHRVHAFVMTTNIASIRLLERAGFAREGTLMHFRMARGTPRDFYIYAILQPDWSFQGRGAPSNPTLERAPPR
jgi:ribosomal-protein-alanine N-acetyltransferase